eukprot:4061352-Amphidinium_carterae.1
MTQALSLAEAHIRSELITTKVLPDDFVQYALAKRVSTVAEILELLFQRYLPSEPSARIDALTILETPLRPAKSFQEALRSFRTWKELLVVSIQSLHAQPDMLRLYHTIQPLLGSLFHDTQFSVAHANIIAVTNVRITPDSNTLWRYIELLEAEMNERAMEELD